MKDRYYFAIQAFMKTLPYFEVTPFGRRIGMHMQSPLWAVAASELFVAALLALLIHFGAHEQVLRLLRWFDAQGAWAPLLFILIMAAVVVLVLPGVLFTTGAGFVFAVVEGAIVIVLGTTLGAALAFLIARHLLGQRWKALRPISCEMRSAI